jgi:deoxyribodipyrimidine photolyase-related protein
MRDNPALQGAGRVLFVESWSGLRRVRTHRRRAHLVLSAMRRFAAELRERGDVEVVEVRGARDFAEGVRTGAGGRALVAAAPNSAGARRGLARLGVRFVASNQFLTDPDDFAAWARGRGRLVMEDFYREQRRRFAVLLDADGRPEGGRWNFDRLNRRPPAEGLRAPDPWLPQEDATDAEVRADLDRAEADGRVALFGEDGPRAAAATPAEAQAALRSFVADRLADFGPWQDAMVPGERVLFHSLLSAPLNLGLLAPLDAVRAAEDAYRRGDAPLASVEGFVRQVIGWREYVWGMYWLRRDDWASDNALGAELDLPEAFWGARTGWSCLDQVADSVRTGAYAHHIERLMVLGNIMLLAGVRPWQAVRWFQGAFHDGAEWVMAPNAAGMALFADGGTMMTKPYAGGGNYINRMSGFCPGCRYEPNRRTGERACPVTALYWDFVDRHADRLAANRRTRNAVGTLRRFDEAERAAIRERAAAARAELRGASPRA